MIVWAGAGLFVGWLVSTRLRADSLGVFLACSAVLPVVAFAAVRRFDLDILWNYAAFWLAVQGSYFVANLLAERRRPTRDDLGDDRRLESA